MRPHSSLIVATLLAAAPAARAEQWAIGAVALPRPALSLQYQPTRVSAWHVATYYDSERIVADGDHQRFWFPNFLLNDRDYASALYAGLGLRGESVRAEHAEENFALRFPVGVQAELKRLHVSFFAEGAALLGPLPDTQLLATYSTGLRAAF